MRCFWRKTAASAPCWRSRRRSWKREACAFISTPRWNTRANALLIAAFVLLILGLYISFFMPPVLVKVDGQGYAVGGPKPEGIRIKLDELLQDCRLEDHE